jgi:hypothetical protein
MVLFHASACAPVRWGWGAGLPIFFAIANKIEGSLNGYPLFLSPIAGERTTRIQVVFISSSNFRMLIWLICGYVLISELDKRAFWGYAFHMDTNLDKYEMLQMMGKSECLGCRWIGVFEGLFCPTCAVKRGER